MKTLTTIALGAAALLSTACATTDHRMARSEAVSVLQAAEAKDDWTLTTTGAQSAAWGDRWTAANLFERAAADRDDIRTRFNLANAYHSTGRLAEAAALYETLIQDGQYTWGRQHVNYKNRAADLRGFNVADESARRLAMIRGAAAPTTTGVAAAGQFAVPTAAMLDAVSSGSRRVSDAEAINRDAVENPVG